MSFKFNDKFEILIISDFLAKTTDRQIYPVHFALMNNIYVILLIKEKIRKFINIPVK